MDKKENNDELFLLEKAFKEFNITTQKLHEAYGSLEGRLAQINVELAQKNKELEHSLEENKKIKSFLDKIIANMPVGVIYMDLFDNVKLYNQYADETFGFSKNNALFFEFFRIHIEKIISGEREKVEDEILFQDKVLNMAFTPLKDENALLEGILITFQDITLKKELEKKLRIKTNNEVLGEMSAIMAHELKTPIAGIEGMLALLRRDLANEPDKVDMIDKIMNATRNITKIISELLSFTRPMNPDIKKIDVKKEILNVIDEMFLKKDVKIVLNMENFFWYFDRMLFRQMLFNILSNANEAIPEEDGVIKIEAFMNKNEFVLKISDNGAGIPENIKDNLFKPFFTTKSKGTGLGLAFVAKIVEQHNGKVDVVSSSDGTEFILTFRRDYDLSFN